MIKDKIYTSYFLNKNYFQIEPFYVIHRAKNIKNASESAKSFYYHYLKNKNRGAIQINQLMKKIKIFHKINKPL